MIQHIQLGSQLAVVNMQVWYEDKPFRIKKIAHRIEFQDKVGYDVTIREIGKDNVLTLDLDDVTFYAFGLLMDIGGIAKELALRMADKVSTKKLGLFDWTYKFCEHFVFRGHSKMLHEPLCRTYDTLKPGDNMVIICPRGNAKTTWTQMFLLKCICEQTEPYILLVMDTTEQAEQSLKTVREELESNEKLRDTYSGIEKGLVWNNKEIQTSGGVCVQALGTGKKVRGRRFRQNRPALIILDDPQNDESVETPGQRNKEWNWFQKALMKCGETNITKTVVIGTVLHKECIVCRAERLPSFKTIRYKSIISWPTNRHMWDEWRDLYLNAPEVERDGARQRDSTYADEYYDTHYDEMNEGAVVLWEEKENLEDLMKQHAEDPVSFLSEKQNESFDPSQCEFNPEWISRDREAIWYETVDEISNVQTITVGFVDWGKGKESKRHDFTAVITGHYDGIHCYIEADIQKQPVSVMASNIIGWEKQVNYDAFGVETTGFQDLAKDDLEDAAIEQKCVMFLDKIYPMDNQVNKKVRIARLSSWLQRGFFKFNRHCHFTEILMDQLFEFPNPNAHDDGPDALEGMLRLLNVMREGGDLEELGHEGWTETVGSVL